MEGAVEFLCGERPSPSRVRVAVGPRALAVHQALADLFAEALRLIFETLLVDGVGLRGEDEPLRVQRLPQVGDLDLAHLRAERMEDLDRFPDWPLDLFVDVLEVELPREAYPGAADAASEVPRKVFLR